jgi:hypothetical protein
VEAEESPLLEAVIMERLVKTQQAGKDLAGAVVICELLAVPSCVSVVNKSNIQSKTTPRVTPKYVTISYLCH